MRVFLRFLVGAMALSAFAHAAPTSTTTKAVVHQVESIVEASGTTPWSQALALLRELVRPWVSTTQLDAFFSQFSGVDGSRRVLDVAHPSRLQGDASHSRVMQTSVSTDTVKDEFTNGWIDGQQWRSFNSPVSQGDGNVVQLHYVTATGSGTRGGVIISVGHTEPAEKYAEQIHDLVAAGFSPVYALDHRGQGRSSRLLDDTFKSHVVRFDHFVQDFRAFTTLASTEMGTTRPRFLHCHSMGCAIAFSYLISEFEAQRPNVFNAVAANAPLIQPLTDPFPYQVAVAIGQIMLLLGLGESYPPTKGEKTFDEMYAFDPTDSARQGLYNEHICVAKRSHQYAAGHTGLCLGDVTANFAAEFFGTYSTFQEFTQGTLSVPILIQQARTNEDGSDGTVINAPQETFCSDACDSCVLTRYPNARHNIWFETDSIRTPALNEVLAFYDQHAGDVIAQNSLPPKCAWWQFWCSFTNCGCVW